MKGQTKRHYAVANSGVTDGVHEPANHFRSPEPAGPTQEARSVTATAYRATVHSRQWRETRSSEGMTQTRRLPRRLPSSQLLSPGAA